METTLNQTEIEKIADAVAQRIRKILPKNDKSDDDKCLLNTKQAAEYMRVKVSWLQQNHERLGIPKNRIGGNLLFDKKALNNWIDKQNAS